MPCWMWVMSSEDWAVELSLEDCPPEAFLIHPRVAWLPPPWYFHQPDSTQYTLQIHSYSKSSHCTKVMFTEAWNQCIVQWWLQQILSVIWNERQLPSAFKVFAFKLRWYFHIYQPTFMRLCWCYFFDISANHPTLPIFYPVLSRLRRRRKIKLSPRIVFYR